MRDDVKEEDRLVLGGSTLALHHLFAGWFFYKTLKLHVILKP